MKKILYSFAFLLVVILSTTAANAQILERNDMIYNSSLLPQVNRYNPALFMQNRNAYISLPNVGLAIGLPIAYSDFNFVPVTKKGKEKYNLDIYSLADQLRNDKSIHFGFDADLLGFGFHAGRFIFTFDASVSAAASIYFPDGLTSTIADGLVRMNEEPVGVTFKDFASVSAYERFAIGLGYDITDRFTLGARVNILNGIMSASLSDVNINLFAHDDAYSDITATVQYRMLRAGMYDLSFVSSDSTDFSHSFSNIGYTFDLGAAYTYGNLSVSASIVDFGPGIHWKDNPRITTPKYTTFDYQGGDMGDFINGGTMDADFFNNVADTLKELVKYNDQPYDDYWQSIPTKIYLGASYKFNNIFRANLLFHGEWDKGMLYNNEGGTSFFDENSRFRYNTSLSAAVKAGNWVELMVANAFCFDGEKGSLFNPGVGLTIAPANAVQLFIMADYISSFKAVDIKGTTLQFGLNIVFGHNRTKDPKISPQRSETPIF